MTEMIFGFLEQIGFIHPLHPAMTHIPMGMVMGALVFRIVSFIPKFKILAKTGYHCMILGLLGIIPTAFTGYLDWQHRYGGEWEFLVILKMALAVVLAIIMLFIAIKDDPENPGLNRNTIMYLIMLIVAIGLGFSGGELQYG